METLHRQKIKVASNAKGSTWIGREIVSKKYECAQIQTIYNVNHTKVMYTRVCVCAQNLQL